MYLVVRINCMHGNRINILKISLTGFESFSINNCLTCPFVD